MAFFRDSCGLVLITP